MKLGILGGSFNPVHLGHLFLADNAINALKLDRIVMIPAYRSPFKLDAKNMETSAEDRLQMLAAAVCADSRIALDDCEIRREGVSYTINTIEDIIARYLPSGKPFLIIGDDLAGEFLNWKNSKKILQLAEIAVARRINSQKIKYPFPHIVLENEVMDISSQMVRQKIAAKTDWRSLVPSGVRAIIEDKSLYGYSGAAQHKESIISSAFILHIEDAVRKAISTVRFLHSRNTALLAYDLCLRFNHDPMEGYLAGIAHDFCKQLDPQQMLKLAKKDGKKISALEKEKPNLLHGRAAAVLLEERFSIHNRDILDAVSLHTLGSEDMGFLAKVIYIADKVEVSRNVDSALRRMCYEENSQIDALDNILYAVLMKTVSKIKSKKLNLSDGTKKLLEKVKGKIN